MKHLSSLLLLLALLLAGPALRAQNQAAPSAGDNRYEYCEVRVVGDDVYADFGYGTEKLGGPELSKLEVGKLQVFATPISALNYLGSLGWEAIQVVQSVPVNVGKQGSIGNRYYVLRRLRSAQGVNVSKP